RAQEDFLRFDFRKILLDLEKTSSHRGSEYARDSHLCNRTVDRNPRRNGATDQSRDERSAHWISLAAESARGRIQPSPKLVIRNAHNTHSNLIHYRSRTDSDHWRRFRLFFLIRYLSRRLEQGQGLDGIDRSPRRAQMERHGLY